MRRYYYITTLAVCAICLLQALYIANLHNRYIKQNITDIDRIVVISVDKELHLRSLRKEKKKPRQQQYISVKRMEDMSPQEIDSLTRICPLPSKELYNIDAAREKGIAKTSTELVAQVIQDSFQEEGFPLDLTALDSIFVKEAAYNYPHAFILYNEDKEILDSVGTLENSSSDYVSKLTPIGTKGLQYLQVKADIPLLPFIKEQVWALLLSAILMIFTILCMAYHLLVIRRKDTLLQQREDTINGTIHDLKAPLNSVVTTLSWLESTEANAVKKKAVEISQAEVRHLVCNIESLLVTVRKDRKRLILKKEETDIPHLAEIVKNSMDALYRTKPHTIEIENRLPKNMKVVADGMYIENVIRNLVENALKYSDDGVNVKVTLQTTDGMLQVAVQDDGWGIAPQYQKKLFRQFYQVPRGADRIRKGYGIGLAQSKYIIDAHKGKLSVKSAEGKGSEFSFTIPVRV